MGSIPHVGDLLYYGHYPHHHVPVPTFTTFHCVSFNSLHGSLKLPWTYIQCVSSTPCLGDLLHKHHCSHHHVPTFTAWVSIPCMGSHHSHVLTFTAYHYVVSIPCVDDLLALRALSPPPCTYIHCMDFNSFHRSPSLPCTYIHCMGSISHVGDLLYYGHYPHHHVPVPTFTTFHCVSFNSLHGSLKLPWTYIQCVSSTPCLGDLLHKHHCSHHHVPTFTAWVSIPCMGSHHSHVLTFTAYHYVVSIPCVDDLLALRALSPPPCTYIHCMDFNSFHRSPSLPCTYIHCMGSIPHVGDLLYYGHYPHHHVPVPTFTTFHCVSFNSLHGSLKLPWTYIQCVSSTPCLGDLLHKHHCSHHHVPTFTAWVSIPCMGSHHSHVLTFTAYHYVVSIPCVDDLLALRALSPPPCTYIHCMDFNSFHRSPPPIFPEFPCVGSIFPV